MNRSFRWIAPLLAVATVSATSGAQDLHVTTPAQAQPAPSPAVSSPAPVPSTTHRGVQRGPTLGSATAGVRVNREQPAPTPAPRRAESKQSDAMMIVGGAGLIVGAIIGDTAGALLMVGGAVIGLFGLYKYLE